MIQVILQRGEAVVKLDNCQQRELTQSLVYYMNFLRASIYNERDRESKQALRNRLQVATKLYFLFEQDTIRIKTGLDFHRNWRKKSEEILASKLQF